MVNGLIAKKLGMTQIFDKEGNVIPVTVIEAGPCVILELKESPFKVKLGFEAARESRTSKPRAGYFKKIGVSPLKIIQEFHSTDNKDYKVGQEIKADRFRAGDFVDVTGVTIGRGFQGGVKRWGWAGGPGSHGSMHHRRVGSIGSSSEPSRVWKGFKMPGHMGHRRMTTQGLRVMDIDKDNNLLLIKGAVPGHRNGYVTINISQRKKFRSLEEQKAASAVKRNPMKQSKAKAKGKGK